MSADLLLSLLAETGQVEVRAVLHSVRDGINYLKQDATADLILSDIQLPDGLSFSIFDAVPVSIPVIFISAYDQYMIRAFEFNGIDYLLKPVDQSSLDHSLARYKNLERHFTGNGRIKQIIHEYFGQKKTRIIVRKGLSSISLHLSDVVLFYTENMVVYVVDQKGVKYLVDKSLNSLEQELDDRAFFRANRQYLIHIRFVQGYKTYERVKLLVSLTLRDLDHVIVVGQEKARAFRRWMEG